MHAQTGTKNAAAAGRLAMLGRQVPSREPALQKLVARLANEAPPFPKNKPTPWRFGIKAEGPAGERDAKPNE